ncbi:MAG: TIGR03905 family TSCPD domain-containing protein [Eggerthellaceae bacterium]|nr:TIGR03905 family TSCPD domain-containing protein [Eggerthellaceae bacterium]
MHTYKPKGVCSQLIGVELEDDGATIKEVRFMGGCDGNLKAIAKLVAGKKVDEIVPLLEGNTCGRRSTSCADQLTKALLEAQQA